MSCIVCRDSVHSDPMCRKCTQAFGRDCNSVTTADVIAWVAKRAHASHPNLSPRERIGVLIILEEWCAATGLGRQHIERAIAKLRRFV